MKTALKLFAIIALFNLGIFARAGVEGVRWQLASINGQKVQTTKAYLEIKDDRVTGNAACNRLFGTASIAGGKIEFSRLGTTRMLCMKDDLMTIERDFLNALGKTTRFQRIGDTLNFYAKNRLVLKFKAAAADDSGIKLEDKKWVLESIKGKSLPKLEAAPFLNFDRQKKSAGGNTGCNSFGGSYETSGASSIRFFDLISTMRACVEDRRMNVEREFTDALQKADRFEIAGSKLNLYRGKTLLLTFRAEEKGKSE